MKENWEGDRKQKNRSDERLWEEEIRPGLRSSLSCLIQGDALGPTVGKFLLQHLHFGHGWSCTTGGECKSHNKKAGHRQVSYQANRNHDNQGEQCLYRVIGFGPAGA